MRLKRRKSRTQRAADLLGTYVKFKAAAKAAKWTRKAVKGAAAYQIAKRTPIARALPIAAGATAAAVLGARKLRERNSTAATA